MSERVAEAVLRRFLVVFELSADSLTWLVKRESDVLSRHVRKRDAVRAASRVARDEPPSELVIERMNGTVEACRNYSVRDARHGDPCADRTSQDTGHHPRRANTRGRTVTQR